MSAQINNLKKTIEIKSFTPSEQSYKSVAKAIHPKTVSVEHDFLSKQALTTW